MAAEPGSSEGAAEVVAGVGQICKVELELAATSLLASLAARPIAPRDEAGIRKDSPNFAEH